MSHLVLAGALVLTSLFAGPTQEPSSEAEVFQQGVEAYRAGDHVTAQTLWRGLWDGLEGTQPSLNRADLGYDLGNAAFRLERPLEAAGWYASALRLRPRDADLWANLELARERAQLEPADRGDLAATVRRLLDAMTLSEAEWLVLLLALAMAAVLVLEAYLPSRGSRRAVQVVGLLLGLSLLPWCWRLSTTDEDPHFVIAAEGLPVRSEPRASAAEVERLDPGATVEAFDALPGWVRVHTPAGVDGWVPASELLRLNPALVSS